MRGLLLAFLLLAGPAMAQPISAKYGPGDCPFGASGCQVKATGSTTSRTLAARAADASNAKDFGVVCDGAIDDYANMQSAITTATAAGKQLVIYATGNSCLLSNTLIVPSNANIYGVGGPTLKVTASAHSEVFSIHGSSGVRIAHLALDGNLSAMSDTSAIIGAYGMTNSVIDDVVITNAKSGIVLSDGFGFGGADYNKLSNIKMTGATPTSALSIANSNYNEVTDFRSDGHTGFTVWITGTAQFNKITRPVTNNSGIELVGMTYLTAHNSVVDPDASLYPYTAWASGISVTSGQTVSNAFNLYTAGSTGTTGASAPTCTSSTCSDGTITWTFLRANASTGDNCFSMSGSYNSVIGGRGEGCWRDGVAMYGDHNIAAGTVYLSNAQSKNHGGSSLYACINFESNYGGIAQYNTAVGNSCEDAQTVHTVNNNAKFQFGYPAWTTGTTYAAGFYVFNSGKVYQTSAGGVAGASAPTCSSGTCSDGTVTWAFIRTFLVGSVTVSNTQASSNVLEANMFGQTLSGTDISDATQSQINYVYQPTRLQNTNYKFDSNGVLYSGTNLTGFKLAQTWTANGSVKYGETYTSLNGRQYRVINVGGTVTAGNSPTVASGTQTTADGVQWLMVSSGFGVAQYIIENQFFNTPGCVKHGADDSLTLYILDCAGAGTPESIVTAPIGSVYHRTDGGAATSFYVKESGAAATGWVAK